MARYPPIEQLVGLLAGSKRMGGAVVGYFVAACQVSVVAAYFAVEVEDRRLAVEVIM